jgi:uncharacterized protein (UPF0297 family)
MPDPKKGRKKGQTTVPSLSCVEDKDITISEIREKVFSSMNNAELEKALDTWLKDSHTRKKVNIRDLGVLKRQIGEYLDVFITFGYNLEGDRIVIQHFNNARDRDAIMEFLKTIFLKQQQENFLDIHNEDDN